MKFFFFKNLFLIAWMALSAGLSSCTGAGTPGGGALPGGVSGPGGHGAPPISIPGPEALNMTYVEIGAPDSTGNVTVTGLPGAAAPGPGHEVRVRDLGDVAWYSPLKSLFLKKAYAAAGGTCTSPVGPDGSFKCTVAGAAVGDWMGVRLCAGTLCSAEFRKEVLAVPNLGGPSFPSAPPSGGAKIQKMTSDPGGNIFFMMNTPKKKRHWIDFFISSAYAEEPFPRLPGSDPLGTPLPGLGDSLPPGGLINVADVAFRRAECSAEGFQNLDTTPQTASPGSVCEIKMRPSPVSSSTGLSGTPAQDPIVALRIPNCEQANAGMNVVQKNGKPWLAVYSGNKLWFYDIADPLHPVFKDKYSYWAEIAQVQVILGETFVTLNTGLINLPSSAVGHQCAVWGITSLLNGVTFIHDFRNTNYEFAMAVTYGKPNPTLKKVSLPPPVQSCLLVGNSDVEFSFNLFQKALCQPTPITQVVVATPTRVGEWVCGSNYVALSPETRELIHVYRKRFGAPDYCPSDQMTRTTIDGAAAPLSLAWDGDKTVAVLDAGASGTQPPALLSYQIQPNQVQNFLISPTRMELARESAPSLLIYNQRTQEFVTNAPSSEGSMTSVSRTRMRRAAPADSSE